VVFLDSLFFCIFTAEGGWDTCVRVAVRRREVEGVSKTRYSVFLFFFLSVLGRKAKQKTPNAQVGSTYARYALNLSERKVFWGWGVGEGKSMRE